MKEEGSELSRCPNARHLGHAATGAPGIGDDMPKRDNVESVHYSHTAAAVRIDEQRPCETTIALRPFGLNWTIGQSPTNYK
jgi:hypothetical protein